jgi:hypothetical protein
LCNNQAGTCLIGGGPERVDLGISLTKFLSYAGFWHRTDTQGVDLTGIENWTPDITESYKCWTDQFYDEFEPNPTYQCGMCVGIWDKDPSYETGYLIGKHTEDRRCDNSTNLLPDTSNVNLHNCAVSWFDYYCIICEDGYNLDYFAYVNYNSIRPDCISNSDCTPGKEGYYYEAYTMKDGY